MNPEARARYELAIEASRAAGKVALKYFQGSVEVEWKKDQSPVTVADREAEQSLRDTLLAKFPQDGFLGEEFPEKPSESGYRWIVDPIDGTRCFVRGIPIWGTLVGLQYQGEMIAGINEVATLGETYHALKGNGAYRNDIRISVTDESDLKKCLLFFTALDWFEKAGEQETFFNLVRHTERQRGFGDFYGFMLVAQGSGEVMIDHGVHIWDVAAIQPIIEEAGGRFTNWDGGCDLEKPDVIVTNGKVHDEVLALLKK